jgi:predicted lipid-binding transport protein (Tim44 family)
MRRTVGALAFGLGAGLGIGMLGGRALGWPALVLLGIGAALLIMSIGDAPRPAEAQPARPALAGLGERTEQILKLAEEQAEDHVRQAREEARRIVAEARAGHLPD